MTQIDCGSLFTIVVKEINAFIISINILIKKSMHTYFAIRSISNGLLLRFLRF